MLGKGNAAIVKRTVDGVYQVVERPTGNNVVVSRNKQGTKDAIEAEYLPGFRELAETTNSIFVRFATNGKLAQHNRNGNDENAEKIYEKKSWEWVMKRV